MTYSITSSFKKKKQTNKDMQKDSTKMRLTQSSFGNNLNFSSWIGGEKGFISTAQGIVRIMNCFKHAVKFKCLGRF